MDGTILGQGTFVASPIAASGLGAVRTYSTPVTIAIPSGVDWMKVRNFSQYGANGVTTANFQGTANASIGIEFYWQRGMAAGTAIVLYKGATSAAIDGDTLVSGGFTLYDPSGQTPGALPLIGNPVATTASTNATNPVVSTASTAGLSVGSIVRISGTAQTDVNGIDMVVGAVTTNTSFELLTATNALATAPGVVGGAGFYRIVNYNPLFYPRRRYVVNIVTATGQVSTSIPHGLTPGQTVRFEIPAVSGMIQLNPTAANNYLSPIITSVVDDYNFIINTNTTAFTAFTWPTTVPLQTPVSFPSVTPVGEDTATALVATGSQVPSIGGQQIFNTNTGILADSTVNTGFLGMILGSGGSGNALTTPIIGPAGSGTTSNTGVITLPDTLYWVAGKSTYGGQ
jgi:hypothetical protein